MQMQSWAIAVILGCVGGDLHAEKKICMQKSARAASISIYSLHAAMGSQWRMEILEQIPNAVNMKNTKKRAEGNFTTRFAATKHWVDSSLSDKSIKKLRSKKLRRRMLQASQRYSGAS